MASLVKILFFDLKNILFFSTAAFFLFFRNLCVHYIENIHILPQTAEVNIRQQLAKWEVLCAALDKK